MTEDYYQILGVNKNASDEDIKKAYRKMAMKHHPDRGGDVSIFQKIQEAYDTLSDPDKKARYDNPQPEMQGFHFGQGFPPGFEDLFSQFRGQFNPFENFFQQRQPQKNKNLNIQTEITLEEAFTGKELVANLRLPSGKEQLIEVKIPAGITHGNTLRLAGLGDDSFNSMPRGDLYLTINIRQHSIFQRQGDDLIMKHDLNCIDAILGKTILVSTIDGKTLSVTLDPGIQHGTILALNGCGMPKMSDNRFKGRLLLSINIIIPTNINDNQKNLLKIIQNS